MFSAPRGWFTLQYFGKANVVILNGGLPKWKAEGRAICSDRELSAIRAKDESKVKYAFKKHKNFVAGFHEVLLYS
jgi:3-mercaptopyruvate sulfurtransferase SseA